MKSIGIKVLKARLSHFIRMVKAGETVLVTDRDEVVAELRPAHRQHKRQESLRDKLEEWAERGEVSLASENMKNWVWNAQLIPPPESGIKSIDLLDELRKDPS